MKRACVIFLSCVAASEDPNPRENFFSTDKIDAEIQKIDESSSGIERFGYRDYLTNLKSLIKKNGSRRSGANRIPLRLGGTCLSDFEYTRWGDRERAKFSAKDIAEASIKNDAESRNKHEERNKTNIYTVTHQRESRIVFVRRDKACLNIITAHRKRCKKFPVKHLFSSQIWPTVTDFLTTRQMFFSDRERVCSNCGLTGVLRRVQMESRRLLNQKNPFDEKRLWFIVEVELRKDQVSSKFRNLAFEAQRFDDIWMHNKDLSGDPVKLKHALHHANKLWGSMSADGWVEFPDNPMFMYMVNVNGRTMGLVGSKKSRKSFDPTRTKPGYYYINVWCLGDSSVSEQLTTHISDIECLYKKAERYQYLFRHARHTLHVDLNYIKDSYKQFERMNLNCFVTPTKNIEGRDAAIENVEKYTEFWRSELLPYNEAIEGLGGEPVVLQMPSSQVSE